MIMIIIIIIKTLFSVGDTITLQIYKYFTNIHVSDETYFLTCAPNKVSIEPPHPQSDQRLR